MRWPNSDVAHYWFKVLVTSMPRLRTLWKPKWNDGKKKNEL